MNDMNAEPTPGAQSAEEARIINLYRIAEERILERQSLPGALMLGIPAAILSGALWAAVTVLTGWMIGYAAIAVGFIVGYAVRFGGKGMTKEFGFAGALLAFLGCALGNYGITAYYIAEYQGLEFMSVLLAVDPMLIIEATIEASGAMDLLFYGIAMWEGYKIGTYELTEQDIRNADPMFANDPINP